MVVNGVASKAPFLTTRKVPPCSATKSRPSGACANAVAFVRPATHAWFNVKPFGRAVLPPNWTSAVDHDETLPLVSVARARSTCWPAG